jgi:hypothetical protein
MTRYRIVLAALLLAASAIAAPLAQRELLEVGANLAVNVASDRIRTSITTDDQTRLVDRYASQIGTGRGEARQ